MSLTQKILVLTNLNETIQIMWNNKELDSKRQTSLLHYVAVGRRKSEIAHLPSEIESTTLGRPPSPLSTLTPWVWNFSTETLLNKIKLERLAITWCVLKLRSIGTYFQLQTVMEREKLQWVNDSIISISVVQVSKENPAGHGIILFVKCPGVYRWYHKMLQWYMCKYQVGIDPCIEGCDTSQVGYWIPVHVPLLIPWLKSDTQKHSHRSILPWNLLNRDIQPLWSHVPLAMSLKWENPSTIAIDSLISLQ